MMYERPPTLPFQNPPQNTTFPFQNHTLVFQQHQDEPIYDVWTRFRNLIQESLIMALIYGPLLNSFIITSTNIPKWTMTLQQTGTLGNKVEKRHGKPLKTLPKVIFDEKKLGSLRKFHWMILRGRFNQLSHVSSPLLSKPGEY
ncbi:hypothetical protein Tco_0241745 [Tanacetum coccineum]